MNFPLEFREKVIAEGLSSGKSYRVLAEEFGIGYSTLGKWLRDYRNSGVQPLAKKEKRPQDWSIEQRFDAVLETQQLSEEEVGRWCREHGLHTHQLSRWRQDAMAGTGDKKVTAEQGETRQLREENRSLKKKLRRKEKALAETAALLVLKKKPRRYGESPRTIDG
jgi:transposase